MKRFEAYTKVLVKSKRTGNGFQIYIKENIMENIL